MPKSSGIFSENKNRGVQVVKLYVPFLFVLHAAPYQKRLVPRMGMQSKPCCIPEKKENGMEELVSAQQSFPCRTRPGQMFLQEHPFSGATRLDLANLVARTEYHTWLVLSTLIFDFPEKFFPADSFSGIFANSTKKNVAPCIKSTAFLLLFIGTVVIIIAGCRGRGFSLCRKAHTDPPPESRRCRAAFQRLNS